MNLTLYFNPAFDRGCYVADPAKNSASFYEKYVGTAGLLQELELRAGITLPEVQFHEQLVRYHKAARDAAAKDPAIFFAKSLELAPLKTASELLVWRDELVMAGWSATCNIPADITSGAKAIMKGLGVVEAKLVTPLCTEADRWIRLAEAISRKPLPAGLNILLMVPETHLHPLFRSIFDILRKQGVSIKEDLGKNVPEIRIKRFRNKVDACLWAAASASDDLIVCDDTHTLGTSMLAHGKAPVDMISKASLRPIEHLFSDGMALLLDANDIEILRDYLSISHHPLNTFKKDDRNLRYDLLTHIVSVGGCGENKWTRLTFDGILELYANGNETIQKEIRSFLPDASQTLTFKRIQAFCKSLSEWAKRHLKEVPPTPDNSAVFNQLDALINYCGNMEYLCKEMGFEKKQVISRAGFLGAIKSVYAPEDIRSHPASTESTPVVAGVDEIASQVASVFWIDPAHEAVRLPLYFLCESDTRILSGLFPYVWAQQDALAFKDDAFRAGLSRIEGPLSILCCDGSGDEKREQHPFLLKQAVDLKALPYESIPAGLAKNCTTREANTAKEEYSLNGSIVTVPAHESPSSLETMFDCPFDWVIEKVLGLNDEQDSNLGTIEGTVAHSIIHKICLQVAPNGGDVSPAAFNKIFLAQYDKLFEEAVKEYGAELNLPKNKLERDQFHETLKRLSLPVLIDILSRSGLTIVGSEIEFNKVDLSEPGFEPLFISAAIDLLVRDQSGQHIVIDFKWTGNSTARKKREDQIKKGEDYQLAIYRKLLEKQQYSVIAQAFYMLQTAELLTSYPCFKDAKGSVEPVKPGKNQKDYGATMTEIQTRYSKTVRELRAGTVQRPDCQYENNQILKGKLK